ncbi:2'-5' RNA ligase family protein [Rapidithrix thailandica]|uniref:2'-5' RNA ligase family protein n=1 Tax=Rapidithrix thailandica TaxID=413964 RepID=A0AAW9SL88_9BACT
MNRKRKQLSLLIEGNQSQGIEEVRRKHNPLQYGLIQSHVTLCREDEIDKLDMVLGNLSKLKQEPFEIKLETVKRFSEGKGVLIPVNDQDGKLQNLRKFILKGIISFPRELQAHITLMHPRNSACTGQLFEEIKKVEFPATIKFSKISLIEQETGKKWNVWNVLKEFKLKPE